MARRATLIDSLRALDPALVVLDAGDAVNLDSPIAREKLEFILDELSGMAYDAVAVGARELDLFTPVPNAPPVVITNANGRDDVHREVVLERGGLRVGVFALTELPDFTDPFTATEETLRGFEAREVDAVVLLSQLSSVTVDSLLTRYDAIDVAVLGHASTRRPPRVAPGRAHRVYPHPKGRAVFVVDVTIDADARPSVSSERVLLGLSIPADPDVLSRVEATSLREQAAHRAARSRGEGSRM